MVTDITQAVPQGLWRDWLVSWHLLFSVLKAVENIGVKNVRGGNDWKDHMSKEFYTLKKSGVLKIITDADSYVSLSADLIIRPQSVVSFVSATHSPSHCWNWRLELQDCHPCTVSATARPVDGTADGEALATLSVIVMRKSRSVWPGLYCPFLVVKYGKTALCCFRVEPNLTTNSSMKGEKIIFPTSSSDWRIADRKFAFPGLIPHKLC